MRTDHQSTDRSSSLVCDREVPFCVSQGDFVVHCSHWRLPFWMGCCERILPRLPDVSATSRKALVTQCPGRVFRNTSLDSLPDISDSSGCARQTRRHHVLS